MKKPESITAGTLFIVATPIGNLEDITLRAIRILKEVNWIAAEDTRHTQKLLSHLGIHTRLISCYREQESRTADHILSLLRDGMNIALVSDAGTPGISDPGAIVVKKAREGSFHIEVVPGPSALTAAISCAGIEQTAFLFLGFAPAKKNQRKLLLQSLTHNEHHIVFYESPHRISKLMAEALEILDNRDVFLARELTKTFEESRWTTLSALAASTANEKNRGEYVVIIAPGENLPPKEMSLNELICWYRDNSHLSLKDTCKAIASDLGLSRSSVYQQALQIWKDDARSDQEDNER